MLAIILKKRSLAIGIAVCGAGIGTFVLSPINRILVNNYGISGAFLIKAAIVLNLAVCGFLIRPVPIEPSEIAKRNKRKKRDIYKGAQDSYENKDLLNKNNENAKNNCKIADSLPTVYLENNGVKQATKSNQNIYSVVNKNAYNFTDPNEFAKSLPMLTSEMVNHPQGDKNLKATNSKTQLNRSNRSTLDLMAHIRSLQNIAGNESAHSKKSLNFINSTQIRTINQVDNESEEERKKLLRKN